MKHWKHRRTQYIQYIRRLIICSRIRCDVAVFVPSHYFRVLHYKLASFSLHNVMRFQIWASAIQRDELVQTIHWDVLYESNWRLTEPSDWLHMAATTTTKLIKLMLDSSIVCRMQHSNTHTHTYTMCSGTISYFDYGLFVTPQNRWQTWTTTTKTENETVQHRQMVLRHEEKKTNSLRYSGWQML